MFKATSGRAKIAVLASFAKFSLPLLIKSERWKMRNCRGFELPVQISLLYIPALLFCQFKSILAWGSRINDETGTFIHMSLDLWASIVNLHTKRNSFYQPKISTLNWRRWRNGDRSSDCAAVELHSQARANIPLFRMHSDIPSDDWLW